MNSIIKKKDDDIYYKIRENRSLDLFSTILIMVTIMNVPLIVYLTAFFINDKNTNLKFSNLLGAYSFLLIIVIILLYQIIRRLFGDRLNYLAMLFSCHERCDRSFYFGKHKFLVCARCTGIIVGICLATFLSVIIPDKFYYWLPLMVPLIIDGIIQYKTMYESNNLKRLLTGILFGVGMIYLYSKSMALVFWFTFKIADLIINKFSIINSLVTLQFAY